MPSISSKDDTKAKFLTGACNNQNTSPMVSNTSMSLQLGKEISQCRLPWNRKGSLKSIASDPAAINFLTNTNDEWGLMHLSFPDPTVLM